MNILMLYKDAPQFRTSTTVHWGDDRIFIMHDHEVAHTTHGTSIDHIIFMDDRNWDELPDEVRQCLVGCMTKHCTANLIQRNQND